MVPRSPKLLGGCQFFAKVRLNSIIAVLMSPPTFGNAGREPSIQELSEALGFDDDGGLLLLSSVDLGSDILSI